MAARIEKARLRLLARAAGALALAAAAAAFLHAAGAAAASAGLFGLGTGAFALWRTVRGALVGFALMLAAALLAITAATSASLLASHAVPLLPLVLLEVAGLASQVWVAVARQPRRPSRRLLSSQLASTGILAQGLALPPGAGSFLVLLALAYRMGAVPVFAWAPLLIRHPRLEIALAGAAGWVGAALVLSRTAASLQPMEPAFVWALALLGGATLPVGFARALRPGDPRCSLSWIAASLAGGFLVWAVSVR